VVAHRKQGATLVVAHRKQGATTRVAHRKQGQPQGLPLRTIYIYQSHQLSIPQKKTILCQLALNILAIAFPDWVRYIFFDILEPQVPPGAIHIQPLQGCAV
jgi:hypothetical protein